MMKPCIQIAVAAMLVGFMSVGSPSSAPSTATLSAPSQCCHAPPVERAPFDQTATPKPALFVSIDDDDGHVAGDFPSSAIQDLTGESDDAATALTSDGVPAEGHGTSRLILTAPKQSPPRTRTV